MAGPQRARLDAALSGAYESAVEQSANEWDTCTNVLQQISAALDGASPAMKEEIGGQTGPAIDAAFRRSSQGMTAKAGELIKGAQALQEAAQAIRRGRQEQHQLAGQGLQEPPPYRPPVGQPTEEDLQEEARSRQAHAAYAAAFAEQERRAKEETDRMEQTFERATAVMKQIHGIPDPEPEAGAPGGGAGGPGGSSAPGSAGAPAAASGGPHGGRLGTYEPGAGGHPGGAVGSVVGGAAAQGGGSPFEQAQGGGELAPVTGLNGGAGLGIAGAAAGGLGGGMLAAGLASGGIRGGMAPVVAQPGTAASGVRGIGTTARSGVSGALGRPGGAVAASPAAGGARASAAGAGTAAGRNVAARGGAGSSGGRAAAAGVAGAAGRRAKDDAQGRQHDLFDVGEDWVDDEDVAPGVID